MPTTISGTTGVDQVKDDAISFTDLAAAFGGSNVSLNANGHFKLPNGLILQWGRTAAIGQVETTVTLPTPFTTAIFAVVFGQVSIGTGESAVDRPYWDEAASTLSQIVIGRDSDGGVAGSIPITYIAVGY